jgi:hypothetical protein
MIAKYNSKYVPANARTTTSAIVSPVLLSAGAVFIFCRRHILRQHAKNSSLSFPSLCRSADISSLSR